MYYQKMKQNNNIPWFAKLSVPLHEACQFKRIKHTLCQHLFISLSCTLSSYYGCQVYCWFMEDTTSNYLVKEDTSIPMMCVAILYTIPCADTAENCPTKYESDILIRINQHN